MATEAGSTIVALLGEDRRLINYRPSLNKLTGSVTATILLSQVLYWWGKTRAPFYKFKLPCPERNEYNKGDSWCEELDFGRREFDTALAKIGAKVRKGQSLAEVKAQPHSYVLYWTDMNRLTYYMVNEDLLISDLMAVKREPAVTESANPPLRDRKGAFSQYVKREPATTYSANPPLDKIQETTTETTTETNQVSAFAESQKTPINISEIPNSSTPEKLKREKKTKYTAEELNDLIDAFCEANKYKPETVRVQPMSYAQAPKFLDCHYTLGDMRGCVAHMRETNGNWWQRKTMKIADVITEMPTYQRAIEGGWKPGDGAPQKGNKANGKHTGYPGPSREADPNEYYRADIERAERAELKRQAERARAGILPTA